MSGADLELFQWARKRQTVALTAMQAGHITLVENERIYWLYRFLFWR